MKLKLLLFYIAIIFTCLVRANEPEKITLSDWRKIEDKIEKLPLIEYPSMAHSNVDWLINAEAYKANIGAGKDNKSVIISNGLVARVFRVFPNLATIDIVNQMTSESMLRAVSSEGELVIDKMTPGDEVKFTIDVTNSSNVAVQYRINAVSTIGENTEKKDLSEVLTYTVMINGNAVTMQTTDTAGKEAASAWIAVDAGAAIESLEVIAAFPNGTPEHDNPYQEATAKIAFTLEAVQANGIDNNGNMIVPETTNP